MNNTKKPFYVFTAVDGVLFDTKYVDQMHGVFANEIDYPLMKPSSVQALLNLLNTLENKYDTKLVITSHRRTDMDSCLDYLAHSGLNYAKPIYATELSELSRGAKIIKFMAADGFDAVHKQEPIGLKSLISKNESFVGNFDNYVVIDSQKKRLRHLIPEKNTILTDFENDSLSQTQVDEFFNNNGLTNESQNQPGTI